MFLACGYLVGAAAFSARRGRPLTLPLVAGFTCLLLRSPHSALGGRTARPGCRTRFRCAAFCCCSFYSGALRMGCARSTTGSNRRSVKSRSPAAARPKAYYAELMLRQKKKTREFQHEVRHSCSLLQYYLQNGRWEKGQSVFQDLLEQTMPPKALSGNPLINAVLGFFRCVRQREIEFEIRLSGLPALLP